MFDAPGSKTFIVPTVADIDSRGKRFYLVDREGYVVGNRRLDDGTFGPYIKTKIEKRYTSDGEACFWDVHDITLTTAELHELNSLPILWWGMLLNVEAVGTWMQIQCMYTHHNRTSFFTNTAGKTGV